MAASGWPVAIAVFGYRGVVRVVVPKFSKVHPCAAAAGLRSANMRRLPPASVNRAVTAFIHISKEPRRRLDPPNHVGQRCFAAGVRVGVGICTSHTLFSHTRLAPDFPPPQHSWTRAQTRAE